MQGLRAQLLEASFGAAASATISVFTRNWIRTLSATGPGMVTNYWNDGNSASTTMAMATCQRSSP